MFFNELLTPSVILTDVSLLITWINYECFMFLFYLLSPTEFILMFSRHIWMWLDDIYVTCHFATQHTSLISLLLILFPDIKQTVIIVTVTIKVP